MLYYVVFSQVTCSTVDLHSYLVMAAMMGRVQISVKHTSSPTTVPNDPIAKLMYYFSCVASCVELEDSDFDCLRDYKNYTRLTSDEKAKLLALCFVLSPDKLIGTIFHPSSDCGSSSNKFLELTSVKTNLLVTDSLVVGGHSKKIRSIMLFEKSWMERNYYEPFRSFERSRRSPSPIRPPSPPPSPPPPSRSSNDCTIL